VKSRKNRDSGQAFFGTAFVREPRRSTREGKRTSRKAAKGIHQKRNSEARKKTKEESADFADGRRLRKSKKSAFFCAICGFYSCENQLVIR
jgi:hypothetical protein